jgi:hypothetical protein
MSILLVFTAFGDGDFGPRLAVMLWMAIMLCAAAGAVKREPPFGIVLNHWDETIAYAAVFALVRVFNHASPT